MSKYSKALRELNYMLADNDNFYSSDERQTTYTIIKEAVEKAEKYDELIDTAKEITDDKNFVFDTESMEAIYENAEKYYKKCELLEQENKILKDGIKAILSYVTIDIVICNSSDDDYNKLKAMLEVVENA